MLDFVTNRLNGEDAEEQLWSMLEMDGVGELMANSNLAENSHQMGTGATMNACYSCSNSATTAGCGTCGM